MIQNDYLIYPKQFRSAKIPIEKNYCFFLMPFSEDFDVVYGTVKEQLMKHGFVCNRVDEISDSKPIINKIITEILRAQYVIADLTGFNPNVFYELGIAHTFKDAQNVLLIKQESSKIPFDLTHMQYRKYNPKNLKQLASIIREFISNNQYITEFHEALNTRGIIGMVHDNHEEFVDYLQHSLGTDIVTVTQILNHQVKELDEGVLEDTLNRYQILLHRVIDEKQYRDFLPGIFRLYAELLISCSSYMIAETQVSFFLNGFFAQHRLPEITILDYQTNIAVALAEKNKLLTIVLPWIINYFSKSKMASIDLNRYKLEAFLMTTEYEEVNRAIINAVFSSDCHIREHLADIIGEKRLLVAKDSLCRQLTAEENYYSAVSIIEALGKIGAPESLPFIEQWLEEHGSDIISSKMFSVFRHAHNAVFRLDDTPTGMHREQFIQKFGQYITPSVPL